MTDIKVSNDDSGVLTGGSFISNFVSVHSTTLQDMVSQQKYIQSMTNGNGNGGGSNTSNANNSNVRGAGGESKIAAAARPPFSLHGNDRAGQRQMEAAAKEERSTDQRIFQRSPQHSPTNTNSSSGSNSNISNNNNNGNNGRAAYDAYDEEQRDLRSESKHSPPQSRIGIGNGNGNGNGNVISGIGSGSKGLQQESSYSSPIVNHNQGGNSGGRNNHVPVTIVGNKDKDIDKDKDKSTESAQEAEPKYTNSYYTNTDPSYEDLARMHNNNVDDLGAFRQQQQQQQQHKAASPSPDREERERDRERGRGGPNSVNCDNLRHRPYESEGDNTGANRGASPSPNVDNRDNRDNRERDGARGKQSSSISSSSPGPRASADPSSSPSPGPSPGPNSNPVSVPVRNMNMLPPTSASRFRDRDRDRDMRDDSPISARNERERVSEESVARAPREVREVRESPPRERERERERAEVSKEKQEKGPTQTQIADLLNDAIKGSRDFSSVLSQRLVAVRMLHKLWERGDIEDTIDYLQVSLKEGIIEV